MFKNLANLASMMKNVQEMGGRMEEINEELKRKRVTGSAGAGMVTAEANGLGEILKVEIDPSLVESGDREMIEELLPAAINQAAAKSKQLHMEAMQSLTAGFDLPGLQETLGKMSGQSPDSNK